MFYTCSVYDMFCTFIIFLWFFNFNFLYFYFNYSYIMFCVISLTCLLIGLPDLFSEACWFSLLGSLTLLMSGAAIINICILYTKNQTWQAKYESKQNLRVEINVKLNFSLFKHFLQVSAQNCNMYAAYHSYCLNYINALNYLEILRRHDDFCEFEKVF